jgi:hypothetical protein
MPNRMIRDEILESERVLSLPADVRWFFLSVLLTADDLGLFEATDFKLARRATLSPDQAARYLSMLVDVDLVRLYMVDGKRYGFLPRFRQRLQIKRSRYPLPPAALVKDDDAFNKINNLGADPADAQRRSTDVQPSEVEEEEKKKGIGDSTSTRSHHLVGETPTEPMPDCPHLRLLELFVEKAPSLPRPMPELWAGTKAKNLRARWRWVMTARRTTGKRAGQRYATNEDEGVEFFARFFAYVEGSDFLTGRDEAWSGCSLDWLVKESNFGKVLQGNYENKAKVAA